MNLGLRALRAGIAAVAVSGTILGTAQVVLAPMASARYGTVKATTAVNVRASATTSAPVVGVLYQGDTAPQVGEVTKGFVPITYQGSTRYVSATYVSGETSETSSSTTTTKATVWATETVNVRSGAATTYPVVGVLAKGQSTTRTGVTSGAWTQVTFGGVARWVYTSYLTTTASIASASYTVTGHARTTTPLMVRTSSGATFTSLGDLPTGTIVALTGRTANGVSEIVYQGALRWVNSSFLVPVTSSVTTTTPTAPATIGTRWATVALDIRATASLTATVITEVPQGAALPITGRVSNGYAEVVYGGVARWVTAKYLATTASLNVAGSVGLDALTPNGKVIVTTVRANFPQISTMYGVRPDPLPDHPTGHAVDVMLPNYTQNEALGWSIAYYMRAHAAELHISYVIFHQHIWNIARDSEGWRLMADRGSDTANHMNHVHVTVF